MSSGVVELSRLHTDVAAIEQERKSSRAMLNTLMARAPDARLGPPEEVKAVDVQVRLEDAERSLPRTAGAGGGTTYRSPQRGMVKAAEAAGGGPR